MNILHSCPALAEFLREMERLDPAWDDCLDALAGLSGSPINELDGEDAVPYEQLISYFLYRYMTAEDDGRPDLLAVRVILAILSASTIHAIHRATGEADLSVLCEIARMYSSEIEYSEENLERLMDEIEESLY